VPDPVGRLRRNLTSELIEGASDGAVKKSAPNWSNRVFDETDPARSTLVGGVNRFDWSSAEPDTAGYVHGYVRGA
jgi:hypothetical protein